VKFLLTAACARWWEGGELPFRELHRADKSPKTSSAARARIKKTALPVK